MWTDKITTYKIFGFALILLAQHLLVSPAYAQEPPFWFNLIPSYENGRITYQVALYSRVDWPILDLALRVSLPEGTQFIEAQTQPGVTVNSTGSEVIFFTSAVNNYIEQNRFVVQITDPSKTVFSTQGSISWIGKFPGYYQFEPEMFDITRPSLNWAQPGRSRLQLGASAIISNSLITYQLYPKAVGEERMWDIHIGVPLPSGVEFLSAEAPLPFTSSFTGEDVNFFDLELARQLETDPLVLNVAADDTVDSVLPIQAWFNWTNAVRPDEERVPTHEQTMLDMSVSTSSGPQQVIFDIVGDVPFGNYDLRSLAFQEDVSNLLVSFKTVTQIGPAGQPLEYLLFIDADCNSGTGQPVKHRGADYRVQYRHQDNRAAFVPWSPTNSDWDWEQYVELNSFVGDDTLTVGVPLALMALQDHFCWVAQSADKTDEFTETPPVDWLPDEEFFQLTRHQRTAGSMPDIKGKLAIPLINHLGSPDLHVFLLPEGREVAVIPNANQPNFRPDGERLLMNYQKTERQVEHKLNNGIVMVLKNPYAFEGIYEYNWADQTQEQMDFQPNATYPFYSSGGDRALYTTTRPISNSNSSSIAHWLTRCQLAKIETTDQECVDTQLYIENGQAGDVGSSYPVWAANDAVVYRGCTDSICGIHLTGTLSNTAFSTQLTADAADIPADAKGAWIAFTSQRDGNWEAYVMRLDGTDIRNISGSPSSNDGLPTIAPDGSQVAFVSDRDGVWAVWVAPILGGLPQKLFELPTSTPWGASNAAWVKERISWGP